MASSPSVSPSAHELRLRTEQLSFVFTNSDFFISQAEQPLVPLSRMKQTVCCVRLTPLSCIDLRRMPICAESEESGIHGAVTSLTPTAELPVHSPYRAAVSNTYHDIYCHWSPLTAGEVAADMTQDARCVALEASVEQQYMNGGQQQLQDGDHVALEQQHARHTFRPTAHRPLLSSLHAAMQCRARKCDRLDALADVLHLLCPSPAHQGDPIS